VLEIKGILVIDRKDDMDIMIRLTLVKARRMAVKGFERN
jgi:hypothetical protein